MPQTATQAEQVASELAAAYGTDRVSTNASVLEQHGRGEGLHHAVPPEAVFFARSTDELARAVRLCAAANVPIVAYGTGTSLEGHISAVAGGLCIDLSGMDAILGVNVDDLDCTVQAGVTRTRLNEHLKHTGLFFPIDPGADASLGGMAATRASGTNAVRYGTMRDNVLSLTVVLADGRVIRTGGRARKSSAGYDLTRLFVGSEGTLGIITEVTLRLQPVPEAITAAVCAFPSVTRAVNTVIATIQAGVPVARIELLDEHQVAACNAYSQLDLPELPHLFFEFHGSPASVESDAKEVAVYAANHGGQGFEWASSSTERARLWRARHDAYYAVLATKPGAIVWPTDVCVPISALAACISETKAELDASFLPSTIVGHVGDGNFHVLFVIDPDTPADRDEALRLNDRMVERALAMDGTCTGEHGIGMGKLDLLEREHGYDVLDVMRSVKAALDPADIMNPGKILKAR